MTTVLEPLSAPDGPLPPPLPRPPPAARTTPNVQCHAACAQAAGVILSDYSSAAWPQQHAQHAQQVQWQMGAQWHAQQQACVQQQQQHVYADSAPAISQMLVREAEAWRALLGLHGNVLHLARGLSSSTLQDTDTASEREELAEASEQREAAYVASVTHLISQCDQLVAEAVKIRGLRKTKCRVDVHALEDVLRPHSDEALAVGEAAARNGALSIASATSELRQGAQAMRVQIQQARALLTAATERAECARLPAAGTIVMGIRGVDEGSAPPLLPVATVLEHVYQRGALTDEHLSEALLHGALPPRSAAEAPRTFARRNGDRQLRQELVAGASRVDS